MTGQTTINELAKKNIRKTFRRILPFLGICLTLFVGFIIWLMQPAPTPKFSLLKLMPTDTVAGIELRNPGKLFQTIQKKKSIDIFSTLPLIRTIDEKAKSGDKFFESLQIRSEGAQKKIRKLACRIETILEKPLGLGMVKDAVSGSIAIATCDPEVDDYYIIAKSSNAARLAIRFSASFEDNVKGNIPYFKIDNAGGIYLAISHGYIIGANSPERLASLKKRLEFRSELDPDKTLPEQAMILKLSPNRAMHEKIAKQIHMHLWPLETVTITVSPAPNGFLINGTGRLIPPMIDKLKLDAKKLRDERKLPQPDGMKKETALFAPDGHFLRINGFIRPEMSWLSVCKKLWDTPAKPIRGINAPFTTLYWEWLDHGVIAHADGRFALSAAMPKHLDDDLGVPQAPAIHAAWGVMGLKQSRADFNQGIENIVNFFGQPHGDGLFEQIKEETKIKWGSPNRLHLQPLFFNHIEPEWHFITKDKSSFGFFSTSQTADAQIRKSSPYPFPNPQEKDYLIKATFDWRFSKAEEKLIYDLVYDKAINHGFVEEKKQPKVIRTTTLFLAAWNSFPGGSGSIDLTEEESDRDIAGNIYPFKFRLTVKLP